MQYITEKKSTQETQAVRWSHMLETNQQFIQIIITTLFGSQTESVCIQNVGNNGSLPRRIVCA